MSLQTSLRSQAAMSMSALWAARQDAGQQQLFEAQEKGE
jgi:hypothetical protein